MGNLLCTYAKIWLLLDKDSCIFIVRQNGQKAVHFALKKTETLNVHCGCSNRSYYPNLLLKIKFTDNLVYCNQWWIQKLVVFSTKTNNKVNLSHYLEPCMVMITFTAIQQVIRQDPSWLFLHVNINRTSVFCMNW